ncbi:MAG: peptidase M15D vanX D-ala-D-ala dipeptidase [Alphaproteobacteria bacterium]|nr:peptidase M15D vanX D-ala-D-ala dipeptidase [Alphaproteobacteria bacterium]
MFATLAHWRDKPIPDLTSLREVTDSSPPRIDIHNPLYSDALAPAEQFGLSGRNHYAHDRNPPYWRAAEGAIDALLLRPAVGARLRAVNERLAQDGVMLWLLDAWRPRAVQRYFFEVWTPDTLRRRHPEWDEAAVRAAVRRYWSPPTEDPNRPAPHETGAAVDLTLAWRDGGGMLWMGSLFDDPSPVSWPDRYEGHAPEPLSVSDEEARANRRLLHWAMQEEGFAPNPTEWWHFSYGDQYWAKLTGASAALFGLAAPSESGA